MAKPRIPSKNVDLMKLKAPGGGAPAAQMPLMPNQVVFRHKAYLPWWVPLLLPLLLLLALLLFLFLPKNVVVPEVTGAKSTFEAEKTLTDAELKLSAATKQKVSTEAPPGTVIGQTPAAGEKAEKDSEVAIEIAVGNGKIEVPNVVGKTQADADPILRKANLTVGQVSPQPPDPKAKISSQIPAAKEIVKEGTPIAIFTADPRGKKKGDGKVDEKNAGKDGGGGGKGAAAVLPALAGTEVAEAAQKAAEAGLVPEKVNQFSGKKKGTLIGTDPARGHQARGGRQDQAARLRRLPAARLRRRQERPARQRRQRQAPAGDRQGLPGGDRPDLVLRRHADRLRERPPRVPQEPGEARRAGGRGDPGRRGVLRPRVGADGRPQPDRHAPRQEHGQGPHRPGPVPAPAHQAAGAGRSASPTTRSTWSRRCAGRPTASRSSPSARRATSTARTRCSASWHYTSKKAFSPEAKDWGKGKFVTDISNPGKGVIDFSISPDGKQMAAVANFDSDAFQLYLGKPKDFLLTEAKPQVVRACKVAWRSDGLELVVVQADEQCCIEANGQLARMPVGQPSKQQTLGSSGDNPVFQPLSLG